MKILSKKFILVTAASLVGFSGAAVAESGPQRLTDAQMDQVVAGGVFEIDSNTVTSTTTDYFRGYSNKAAPGPGPGTSAVDTVTETTTTITWTCSGANINSCTTGQGTFKGEVGTVVTTTTLPPTIVSGPGKSFASRGL